MKIKAQLFSQLIRYRVAILLFLTSFWIFGWMTNTSDVSFYGLYQVGAESIVEYHTYTLGHSVVPGWKDAGDGDVFTYQQKKFPAKQPGAFYATAVPYFLFHHILKLNFNQNQELVSALNTWFSGGLFAALCVALLYEILTALGFSMNIGLWVSLTYAFGTILFSYSGIAHHDVMASACLLFAFILLTRYKQEPQTRLLFWAGFTLSFALFFSMLPAILVACFGLYAISLLKSPKSTLNLIEGFIVGYLPLGFFNFYYFGNPLTQANVAGNYQDTFFKFSWKTIAEHFHDYFGVTSYLSLEQIMPLVLIGFFGLFSLKKILNKERILFISIFVIHTIYLLNIQTLGHCQFGPRYMIPLIPFMLIGFAGILNLDLKPKPKKCVLVLSGLFSAYSLAVNTLGALGDSMYCRNLVESPIAYYFHNLKQLLEDPFWLRPSCLIVLAVELGFVLFLLKRNAFPLNRRLP